MGRATVAVGNAIGAAMVFAWVVGVMALWAAAMALDWALRPAWKALGRETPDEWRLSRRDMRRIDMGRR